MTTRQKTRAPLLGIAYLSYVIMGVSNGLLGVAWPSIRESFGIPLDALGTLLTTVTIGSILSSFTSGRLVSLIGTGPALMASSTLMGIGLFGYTIAPSWWIMVLSGSLAGMGSGVVNAALNTHVATNYSARHMNWLHASFGLGVTLGPIVMTTVLDIGGSWRWGYIVAVCVQGAIAAYFGLTRDQWGSSEPLPLATDPGPSAGKVGILETLKLPIVWLGIAAFITHPGIQFTVGQWGYSLLTEARSVDAGTAGLWIGIYWASLTAGRLVLGPVADRLGVDRLLRICIVFILLGSLLLWWNVADLLNLVGLIVTGFSLAPLFPSLLLRTPARVGPAHTANAIGYQLAAASIGVALLPGIAGVLAESLGLEIIGPFLVAASIALVLLHEMILRLGGRPQREPS